MTNRIPLLREHGVTHEWIDNHDGTFTVASHQDVAPFLDRNRAMANQNDGYNQSRDMRRLASIPNIVLMQWLNEAGSMEILRDPDDLTAGDVKATFFVKFEPDDSEASFGPYALTKLTDVRFGGRQIRVRYDGVNLDGWRIGAPRLDLVAGGLR